MSLISRLYARMAELPPATHRQLVVQEDLRVPMPDGVELLADRVAPRGPEGERMPILLCRTPYGRRGLVGSGIAAALAERGFQVVTVSCRGTFGSGGAWEPFRNERADGKATLAWLERQPWFSGRVGLYSASYCGLTQWAVIEDAPEWVQAWAPAVTTSGFGRMFHPGGSFGLMSTLTWVTGLAHQEKPTLSRLRGIVAGFRGFRAAAATLPLAEADVAASGRAAEGYADWLEHEDPEDAWWSEIAFAQDLATVPPAYAVAGWYDLFLPYQLDDVKRLQDAGREVRLRVGPWTHGSPQGAAAVVRDTHAWMRAHLYDEPVPEAEPVQLFDMGSGQWRGFPSWPPAAEQQRWHLQAGGGLATDLPGASEPSRYRYDPADPTPSVGGASLHTFDSGPKDNRAVEARADVLTFTTPVLAEDVAVVGEITVELWVRTSLDNTDFFTRLCDVDPKGRSTNLSDGIRRVRPEDVDRSADGSYRVTVRMFPTANTFKAGHRIRLQVSSGAHPLYARNTGSGEPLAKAVTLVASDQEVLHDPVHPSAVVLPVLH